MSRCILNRLQNYGKLPVSIMSPITLIQSQNNFRKFSQNNDDTDKNKKFILGQTTILVQQGFDIQELPCILRKINKDEFETICTRDIVLENNKDRNENNFSVEPTVATKTKTSADVNNEGIIVLLDNCMTSTGILSIINEIPNSCLHPEVAAHALSRLIRNESIIGLKNLEHGSSVFNRLVDCILKSKDHTLILDFMEVLKTFLDLQKTVKRFCDELLLRNSNGILNIIEICECIERFVDCKHQNEAEKFWTGISDKEKSIDDENIKFIYKILPKLKISRRLVIGIIEQRISCIWWNMKPDAITESLIALTECNSSPFRTMQAFARWLNTNIHAVNENNLEIIVSSFTKLDFTNSQIEKALERYIKAKVLKIKSQTLIATILKFCIKFRLRNHHILNGCSEYFISNSNQINFNNIKQIINAYGYLDFQPLNSIKFWQNIENYLKNNFTKIEPQNLIDIFLHCCYIEMYPLNFVSLIFNPHFLDELHSTTSEEKLLKIRTDLKLLDATLALECKSYSGPMLPKDHSAKSIWQDGRIKRMANNINDHIENIAGGPNNYSKNVIIGKLPVNNLYIIDILIHPPGIKNFWSYSIKNDRNIYIAVLILIPEYYNSTGEFLIGPQTMRIRHFRQLGLKVVTLNHQKLLELKMHSKQMHNYLVERVKNALLPLPYE